MLSGSTRPSTHLAGEASSTVEDKKVISEFIKIHGKSILTQDR